MFHMLMENLMERLLQTLTEKFDSFIAEMKSKDDKLDTLTQENINLKSKLAKLEERLDDIESGSRSANLILSGEEVSTLSGDTKQAVTELFRRKMLYELASENILAAYRIGSRPQSQASDSRKVMVKFRDRAIRDDLLSNLQDCMPMKISYLSVPR